MNAIKLLKIEDMNDGTQRLQSQLYVGTDTADFIIEDGVIKSYTYGKNGFDFYPYSKPYQIVENKDQMRTQQL